MARRIGPKMKYLRRFGIISEEGGRSGLSRKSGYGLALEEKQKLKFIYGIMEKQLRKYVDKAVRSTGNPVENLAKIIETRLDNVIYMLGLALTREQARQFVSHGHVFVNGKKVDIPSFNVKISDEVSLDEKLWKQEQLQKTLKNSRSGEVPHWMQKNENKGKINAYPVKEDFSPGVNVTLILELYSR